MLSCAEPEHWKYMYSFLSENRHCTVQKKKEERTAQLTISIAGLCQCSQINIPVTSIRQTEAGDPMVASSENNENNAFVE